MVILMVDALGFEFARQARDFAPMLHERRRLDTVLGFSSGALPTVFTGRMPADHGRFLMYRRALGGSPFAGFEAFAWLPRRVRHSWRVGQWLHRLVERRGVRGYFQLYDVPRHLLPAFDLPERGDIFEAGGDLGASLWEDFTRAGLRWSGRNWRTPQAENLDWVRRRLKEGDEDLLFCYTADLDAALHREGSSGAAPCRLLDTYDAWLRNLKDACRPGEELWLYLVSDHGMVDVDRHIDVMGRLEGLTARWPRDYLAFFDSTMARFWWRSAGARAEVQAALADGPDGAWLTPEDVARHSVPSAHDAFGEDLYLLRQGALLLPSFMGRDPVAAMHGYDPAHPDMAALLWSNRPLPAELKHLRDVRAFLAAEAARLRAAA
jgi:hypothetical protein